MTSVITVANEFIKLGLENESDKTMTNLKIQKLVYIAYAFLLKRTNGSAKLFSEDICAFRHGPVIPDLYSSLKKYGANKVTEQIQFFDSYDESIDTSLNQALVKTVYLAFKDISAPDLVGLTHREGSAWRRVVDRCHGNISYFHEITDCDILDSKEPAVLILEKFIAGN